MIIVVMKMNEVIIKNANLSSNLDEFAENFTGINILLLVNYFSGYDNFPSHAESRDMMAIAMPLGFLRQITLLQEAMNLVAQCQKALIAILKRNLPYDARVYIDNIAVRESKIKYNNEKAFLRVR